MNGTIRWTRGMPRLLLAAAVAGWLPAIYPLSRLEVMVVLLGVPGDGLIRAAYVVQGQRNSTAAVKVDSDDLSASIEAARELYGLEVVAIGHLHPDHLHAFASHVDEENLGDLTPLLATRLYVPAKARRRRLTLEPGAVARLDRIGRKTLQLADDAPVGAEVEYTEEPVEAWFYSITFSPGDDEQPLDLFAHAHWSTGCADPRCASTRTWEVHGVPIGIVQRPADEFEWQVHVLRQELKARVRPSWHYGRVRRRRRDRDDVVYSGAVDAPDAEELEAGDDEPTFEGYRYLRGDETGAELDVAVNRFLAEVGWRTAELEQDEQGAQA